MLIHLYGNIGMKRGSCCLQNINLTRPLLTSSKWYYFICTLLFLSSNSSKFAVVPLRYHAPMGVSYSIILLLQKSILVYVVHRLSASSCSTPTTIVSIIKSASVCHTMLPNWYKFRAVNLNERRREVFIRNPGLVSLNGLVLILTIL